MPLEPLLVNLNYFRKNRYHYSSRNQDYGMARFWEVELVRKRQLSELVNFDVTVGWLVDGCPYAEAHPWATMSDEPAEIKPPVVSRITTSIKTRTINWLPTCNIQVAEMINECDVVFSFKASHQTAHQVENEGCFVQSLTFATFDVAMPAIMSKFLQSHFAPMV